MISQAIKARASDIHFEPYEDRIVVRFREVSGDMMSIQEETKLSLVMLRIRMRI